MWYQNAPKMFIEIAERPGLDLPACYNFSNSFCCTELRRFTGLDEMSRSLIWVQGDGEVGWACSACRWRFPIPTLLTGKEARDAYDRLASAKFREHTCESQTAAPTFKPSTGPTFADRASTLIRRGYKPKDAVELILQEIALESRNNPLVMKKAVRRPTTSS